MKKMRENEIDTPDVKKQRENLEGLLDQLDGARLNSAFYSALAESIKHNSSPPI